MGDVQRGVGRDARQHPRHQHVEHGADEQRAQNADGNVALRIPRFLRGHAHRIEADIGEEDHAGGAEHAGPAELAEGAGVGRNEGHVVGGHDMGKPTKITTSTMQSLIATMRLLKFALMLHAHDQHERDQRDQRHGGKIEIVVSPVRALSDVSADLAALNGGAVAERRAANAAHVIAAWP